MSEVFVMPAVFRRKSSAQTIEAEAIRHETLDDIAEDYKRARIEETQAKELLRFRTEARIKAQERWIEAKAERGLE